MNLNYNIYIYIGRNHYPWWRMPKKVVFQLKHGVLYGCSFAKKHYVFLVFFIPSTHQRRFFKSFLGMHPCLCWLDKLFFGKTQAQKQSHVVCRWPDFGNNIFPLRKQSETITYKFPQNNGYPESREYIYILYYIIIQTMHRHPESMVWYVLVKTL